MTKFLEIWMTVFAAVLAMALLAGGVFICFVLWLWIWWVGAIASVLLLTSYIAFTFYIADSEG